MGQLVDELKPQFEKKINFMIVYIDEAKEVPVAEKYNVQFSPTTVLFNKDGQETENFNGVIDKGQLTQKLTDLAK
jgi:thioredoxin-like negative regulator of GroEL